LSSAGNRDNRLIQQFPSLSFSLVLFVGVGENVSHLMSNDVFRASLSCDIDWVEALRAGVAVKQAAIVVAVRGLLVDFLEEGFHTQAHVVCLVLKCHPVLVDGKLNNDRNWIVGVLFGGGVQAGAVVVRRHIKFVA
jgi:hypothetical protein